MAKRVKAAVGKGSVAWAAGWNVEFHFAKQTRPEIFPTDIKATIQLASESAAHILGIWNQPGPDKQAIAREFDLISDLDGWTSNLFPTLVLILLSSSQA